MSPFRLIHFLLSKESSRTSIKLCYNKHTPNCHLPFFGYFHAFLACIFALIFAQKSSIAAAFGKWFYIFS